MTGFEVAAMDTFLVALATALAVNLLCRVLSRRAGVR